MRKYVKVEDLIKELDAMKDSNMLAKGTEVYYQIVGHIINLAMRPDNTNENESSSNNLEEGLNSIIDFIDHQINKLNNIRTEEDGLISVDLVVAILLGIKQALNLEIEEKIE